MLRSFSFACIVLVGISPVFSQQVSEEKGLRTEREALPSDAVGAFTGREHSDRELPPGDIRDFMKTSPDSAIYQRYLSGRTMSIYGDVCGGVGAGGLFYGLLSEPTNTPAIVIGAVATVAGVILELSGSSQMRQAEAEYRQRYGGPPAAGVVIPCTRSQAFFSVAFRF